MELNLNTENVELNDYQPIKDGKYNAQIIEESEKATKNNGSQLVYKFRIYGDKYNGRTLFCNFNVRCPSSSQAEEIAYKQLAQLGKACGVVNFANSSDIINHCCKIQVAHEEYEGNVRNIIKGFDFADPEGKTTPSSTSSNAKWWETKK